MMMLMMMMTSLRNNMIRRWQTSLHTYHATHTHRHVYTHTLIRSLITQFNLKTRITNCQKVTTQKCEQSIYKNGMIRLVSNAAFNRPHKMLIDDFGYALQLPNFSMYYLADSVNFCSNWKRKLRECIAHDCKIPCQAVYEMFLYIYKIDKIFKYKHIWKIFSLII